MNKRQRVELEGAFLAFCNVAHDLGFQFDYTSKMQCHHTSETPSVVNNNISLDPRDYITKDTGI